LRQYYGTATMPSALDNLKITSTELDESNDLKFIDSLAIDIYKTFFFRNSQRIISFAIANLSTFILIVIFVAPTSLIVFRDAINNIKNQSSINLILLTLLGICFVCLISWNIYLWKRAQRLKSLAILLEKIEQYNHVIDAITLIDKLESPHRSNAVKVQNREELLAALNLIKESLINAMKVETLIRKHKTLINNRYELFAMLEANLTALMAFDPSHQISEYGKLLDDALQIGLTVHKEVRKLHNR
jgi:hypothetical protein